MDYEENDDFDYKKATIDELTNGDWRDVDNDNDDYDLDVDDVLTWLGRD